MSSTRPRVCAVNYLNTVPLVWGMLHGGQRDIFDLSFALPSECADRLPDGRADIGIVPAVELLRQDLKVVPGAGIAGKGAVRSILLISKTPIEEIGTLAADRSSRTSVRLSQIVLRERYGIQPKLVDHVPDLNAMLEACDAALIIGDPALRIDPEPLPYRVLDLGSEWTALTELPMVFAVWAGPRQHHPEPFLESLEYGLAHIDEIADREHGPRGISRELAHRYLTRQMIYRIGEPEQRGLDLFLRYARQYEPVAQTK